MSAAMPDLLIRRKVGRELDLRSKRKLRGRERLDRALQRALERRLEWKHRVVGPLTPNLFESKLGGFGDDQSCAQTEVLLGRHLAKSAFGSHESDASRTLERGSGCVRLAQERAHDLDWQVVDHRLVTRPRTSRSAPAEEPAPPPALPIAYLPRKLGATLQSAKHLDVRLGHLAAQIFDLSASIRHTLMLVRQRCCCNVRHRARLSREPQGAAKGKNLTVRHGRDGVDEPPTEVLRGGPFESHLQQDRTKETALVGDRNLPQRLDEHSHE